MTFKYYYGELNDTMNKQIKNLIIAITLSLVCAPIASLYAMDNGHAQDDPRFFDEGDEPEVENDEPILDYTVEPDMARDALFKAIERDDTSEIERLITQLHVPIDRTKLFYDQWPAIEFTPLIRAITRNKHAAVGMLIRLGANVNQLNDNRSSTALMCANQANNRLITRALIEAGANLKATDLYNRTALTHATAIGAQHALAELIDARAPVDPQDVYGSSALEYAIAIAQGLKAKGLPYTQEWLIVPNEILILLVIAGANPHLPNNVTSCTPWKIATPEVQQLMEDARREREESLLNCRALVRKLPQDIVFYINQFLPQLLFHRLPLQKITRAPAGTKTTEYRAMYPLCDRATPASQPDKALGKNIQHTSKTPNEIECPVCTFSNRTTELYCEICTLPLPIRHGENTDHARADDGQPLRKRTKHE